MSLTRPDPGTTWPAPVGSQLGAWVGGSVSGSFATRRALASAGGLASESPESLLSDRLTRVTISFKLLAIAQRPATA